MSLRTAVPDPSLLLGALALAVVLQVSLAHRPGLHSVGHGLPAVVRPCESVHIQHHTAVDLSWPKGASVVADGKIVARGLYDDQGRDEVGESSHGVRVMDKPRRILP